MEEAAGASGAKGDHEEMSHVMALVEAARKVRAITAQPFAHGQMGSQFGPRERLWPSSAVDVSQDVTSVANAYARRGRRERVRHRFERLGLRSDLLRSCDRLVAVLR